MTSSWMASRRGMPVWVDSPQMMEFVWQNDVFSIFFANDRAAANFKALDYIIEEVLELPESVLPWCEVCGAHGVAIVKTKVQQRTVLSSSAYSLTRLMRLGRTCKGFVKS